jgi:hypothetical protein
VINLKFWLGIEYFLEFLSVLTLASPPGQNLFFGVLIVESTQTVLRFVVLNGVSSNGEFLISGNLLWVSSSEACSLSWLGSLSEFI